MKRRIKLSDFYFRSDETLRCWVYIPFLNLIVSVLIILPMFLTLTPVMTAIALFDAVGGSDDNKNYE